MQIEVKVSIDTPQGHQRAMDMLENHLLYDECYYDLFFDFAYPALKEQRSVLRLRVPCESHCIPHALPPPPRPAASSQPDSNKVFLSTTPSPQPSTGNVMPSSDADEAYGAYVRRCSRAEALQSAEQLYRADGAPLKMFEWDLKQTSSPVGEKPVRALPRPKFPPDTKGKLFLKQKNTVEHGHQLTFVAEDDDVPCDVVQALLRVVPPSLYTTGVINAYQGEEKEGKEARKRSVEEEASESLQQADSCDVFAILVAYARRRPRQNEEDERLSSSPSDNSSAIVRIVRQLHSIAQPYASASSAVSTSATSGVSASVAGVGKRPREEPDDSDAHFTQVRFSTMGRRSTYTQQQQQEAASVSDENSNGGWPANGTQSQGNTRDERGHAGITAEEGVAAATAVAANVDNLPRLGVVGGFLTRRKVYAYTGVHQAAKCSREDLLPDDAFAEALRVRLDTSYLLPGFTIHELEVPRCGTAVEDVMTEVCAFLKNAHVPHHTGSESKYVQYAQYIAATRNVEQEAMDVKLRLTSVDGYNEVKKNFRLFSVPPSTARNVASVTSTLALPALASASARDVSQGRRYMSNTEVDANNDPEEEEDDGSYREHKPWWQMTPYYAPEQVFEDYFFDDAAQTLRKGQSFLRLRKFNAPERYVLTLKAHQVFTDGQQNSLSSKFDLPDVTAQALIAEPTNFLKQHHQNLPLIQTVWDEFGVRQLCRTATFTTQRFTFPWWTSRSQVSTLPRPGRNQDHASASQYRSAEPATQPAFGIPAAASSATSLSQQPHQNSATESDALTKRQPRQPSQQQLLVEPLVIHLDKTTYKVRMNSLTRVPFTPSIPEGERQVTYYEMEVTNISGVTDAKDVLRELTAALNTIGVERTVGVRSKFEQYFTLADEGTIAA